MSRSGTPPSDPPPCGAPKGPSPDDRAGRAPAWRRDTSRWIDGELDAPRAAEVRRRVEADPAAREHLASWRRAMELWREDVGRASDQADPSDMARRVLASTDTVERRANELRPVFWRYAAAAVLLLGLGVAGASLVGPRKSAVAGQGDDLMSIESDRVRLQVEQEWEPLLGRGGAQETGR